MSTITISKKDYQNLLQRQLIIEKELAFLTKNIIEADDRFIRPKALRRWERISRDLDGGRGRFFSSVKSAREWLKSL